MNRNGTIIKSTVLLLGLVAAAALSSCTTRAPMAPSKNRPNIIFVVADDMGWRDTGYSGNPVVKTPHLDKMASAGLRFDQFYSAHATCSPGRMAILTGRTPLRTRMITTVGPMWGNRMNRQNGGPGEVTAAEALKAAGYETAHFGKWGLGRIQNHPLNVGFDEAIWARGHFDNGVSFHKGYSNKSDFDPNAKDERPIKTTGESSVATMDLAIDFMRKRAKRKQPFFVQVCFGSPHGPHKAHDAFKKLYGDLPERDQNYYGEVSGLDAAVGNLRKELRRMKIAKNTIVWFVSDNGGIRADSGGRGKGKIGVRTAGLLEWPGKIPKPMRTTIPVSHLDMYPTVLDAAGVKLKYQPVVDGISLLPLFECKMTQRPKPIGFTVGGSSKTMKEGGENCRLGEAAWIDGSHKLRFIPARGESPERITLHDIYADSAESKDLSAQHPDRVKKMLKDLAVWRKSVQNSYAGKDYLKK